MHWRWLVPCRVVISGAPCRFFEGRLDVVLIFAVKCAFTPRLSLVSVTSIFNLIALQVQAHRPLTKVAI